MSAILIAALAARRGSQSVLGVYGIRVRMYMTMCANVLEKRKKTQINTGGAVSVRRHTVVASRAVGGGSHGT